LRFKTRVRPDEEGIPITNLVDVLFLLIVFFMLSTVLSYDRGLGVRLPETPSPGLVPTRGVSVAIDREGRVFVDGTPVPLDRVGTAVRERQRVQGRQVIIRSDGETRYQVIAEVMDRLLDAGVSDVALPVLPRGRAR